ncbi:unnamed protein product [Parnassius apollo]|uniref:(apollo) hypothetical protein n=1 Tax=Parnassius apollo TaxID=110799 RepID=A0A8S3WBR7_PARAO|nr:unnamed protein product [Parnassius apollo]
MARNLHHVNGALEIDEYPDLNKPTETDLVPIVPSTTENSSIVKCRLVDYSSSPDVSDFEMVEYPHRAATQVEEHCASPSLISENDVFLVSANDKPLLSNKDTYKIDLGVPSCSGLHKPIRPSSSSNSTVSDLDALVHTSTFKKCTAEDIYSYSSAEDDENTDYFIPKGQITPKKLIISSSHEMYKTNNEKFSASDGDYNINLNKQNKSEKQQKKNSKVNAKTNKQQKKKTLDKKNPNTKEVNTEKKVLKCKDITKKQQRKKKKEANK